MSRCARPIAWGYASAGDAVRSSAAYRHGRIFRDRLDGWPTLTNDVQQRTCSSSTASTPLRGEVRVRGAKNLVPKAMVAALLGRDPSRLHDVPAHPRRRGRARACWSCTAYGSRDGAEPGELVLDPTNVERANVDEINVHAGSSRIPILFCGPLLHRLGHAFIPDLGGCHIGDRPIDFHLEALRQFGAIVDKTPRACTSPRPNGCTAPSSSCPTRASARPSRCC